MSKCLLFLFCILCLLFSLSAHAVSASLEQIEVLHLQDHERAIQLLGEIDPESLDSEDREYYHFLDSFLTIYNGDAEYTYNKIYRIYQNAQSLRVKVRSLITLMTQSVYVGHWLQGFEMANQLSNLLSSIENKKLLHQAYQALLLFYINAEQFDIAHSLAAELQAMDSIDANDMCISETLYLELAVVQNSSPIPPEHYERVRQVCSDTGLTYYVAIIDNDYFSWLVMNHRSNDALMLASKIQPNIDKIDVVYLKLTFNAHLSELYFNIGQYEKSEAAANFVIKNLNRREYLPSRILALQTLIKLMKRAGQYEKALDYAEMLFDARREQRDVRVVKEVAYHKANLQLAIKENQIAMLDKENQLLKSETDLANERRQTTSFILLIIGILVLFLLIWSFRTRQLQRKFKQLAQTDSLTGIANRGHFIQTAQTTLQRHHNTVSPCCLILVDLDCFKQINDTYGYVAGDWALKNCVATVKSCLGKGTLFARMGGEEFAILINYCDVERGKIIADSCRAAVERIDTQASGSRFHLTASFGLSDTTQVGYSLDNLLAASDLALHQSKQYGRNKVYVYEDQAVNT